MNALSSVSMGKDSDPAKLFNKLAKIKTAYNSATNVVQESELVMTVVGVAPAKYSETIKTVMKAKRNSLTVKDIKKEMIEHYRFLIARGAMKEDTSSDDGHETVLAATEFQGKCFKCGEVGHKANDPNCPMNKKNNDGKKRFKGKYNLCGMKGHNEAQCFEKEENASKRPKNWKSKLEVANVTKHSDEFLLMAKSDSKLAFKPTMDLLKDLNMFIYYTGATCDSTFSDIGMINLAESDSGTTITYGNGTSVKAAKRGDITGIICNKYGEEIKTATL